MTKKRESSTGTSSSRKGAAGISIGGVILVLFVLCAGYIGTQMGLLGSDSATPGSTKESSQAATPTRAAKPATPPPAVGEPIKGAWYQLYFSTPKYPDKPEVRAQTIMSGLIEALDSAQNSLDIAIYELKLDEIGDAILAARDRGVKVRMVTDTDSLEEDETLIRLKKAKIPIIPDERSAIMHNKFVVVDGQAVWTGSWNFTVNDTYRNNNNGIFIQSPELAQTYAGEFEELFNEEFGPKSPANTAQPQLKIGDTLIETCFAPEDLCADQLMVLLSQAQKSLRFMAFSFTHDGIGETVIDRAKAGVEVHGVFETRGSETESSQWGAMKKAKLDVWQDGNPYTMHHKVFIIDDKTVVLGSFNFTGSADESNDENMLVIHNSEIAQQFLAEFDRVYDQAQNPPKKN